VLVTLFKSLPNWMHVLEHPLAFVVLIAIGFWILWYLAHGKKEPRPILLGAKGEEIESARVPALRIAAIGCTAGLLLAVVIWGSSRLLARSLNPTSEVSEPSPAVSDEGKALQPSLSAPAPILTTNSSASRKPPSNANKPMGKGMVRTLSKQPEKPPDGQPVVAKEAQLGVLNVYVFDDASVGDVEEASITARNHQTNVEYRCVTGRGGSCGMVVPVGLYTVTITAQGYGSKVEAVNVSQNEGGTLTSQIRKLKK
jgi:hypothetical protein